MQKMLSLSLAALTTTMLFGVSVADAQPMPKVAELTRAEAQTRAATRFQRMDVNGDGQLSAADREAAARSRFDAADADGDGQLSFAEVTAAQDQRREMRQERRAARGERRGMGRNLLARQGRMGGRGGEGLLARADTDNDGAISQAEFTEMALARFDRVDADGNGTITAEERRAMRGERGPMRRQRG